MKYLKGNELSYDLWVGFGGLGDECRKNGILGFCGKECRIYGSKSECFDGEEQDIKEENLNT